MLTKELSPIDWTKTRRQIVDQVRGLNPWPVATAELGGTAFKIYRVEPLEDTTGKAPGQLVALNKKGLDVACGDGVVRVTQLQAQGGKRMGAADYFRGHPIVIE
jgi:methionyl-tRNA formyltransferase